VGRGRRGRRGRRGCGEREEREEREKHVRSSHSGCEEPQSMLSETVEEED
jgi:hypothetical protein